MMISHIVYGGKLLYKEPLCSCLLIKLMRSFLLSFKRRYPSMRATHVSNLNICLDQKKGILQAIISEVHPFVSKYCYSLLSPVASIHKACEVYAMQAINFKPTKSPPSSPIYSPRRSLQNLVVHLHASASWK